MAINGTAFFDQKIRQFRSSASHGKFAQDYIRAVNYALAELTTALDLQTAATSITNTSTNIDLADDREWALSVGVDYWLVRLGHKSGDLNLTSAFASWEQAKRTVRVDRDLDDSASATDGVIIAELDD